jgi:4-diphosphocytidyl-2-C-methyl-D-erythritol kinase
VTIQAKAAAKINLRLRIVGQRQDGYHLLESCVVPISIFDSLTIRAAPSDRPRLKISCTNTTLATDQNLALQAAGLAIERLGAALDVEIHLEKNIPIGAGLGGGSSDAAAVLLALDSAVGAKTPQAELIAWASVLGADVPFFVVGRPAWMSGIGEVIEPYSPGPIGPLVVAFPGAGLSTPEVYRAYDRSLTKYRTDSTIRPLSRGRIPLEEFLVNDLESVAIQILPELQTLKQRLRELGAIHTLMTGSGSAVFGVWEDSEGASNAARQMNDEGFWARTAEVLESAPRPK